MTYKDILESKKKYLADLIDAREKGLVNIGTPERIEETEMIIAALEKQVAKEPSLWGDGYADGELVYDMYDCPGCDKSYELYYEKYDCCPKCGQVFDWTGIRLE